MADLQLIWKLGTTQGSDSWVRVGHNSSARNPDAVWAFTTPASFVDSLTIDFVWDCTAMGSGWYANANDYVFAVSADGSNGRFAATGEQIQKIIHTIPGTSTKKGSFSITFTGLELIAGAEYYIRANYNGTSYQTMKWFSKTPTAAYTAAEETESEFIPPRKTLLVETSIKKDDDDDTTDLFMLSGYGGFLIRSEEGDTWTSYKNLGTTEKLYACHYLGGNYIAVGENGTVIVSKDKGETWEKKNIDTTLPMLAVAYGNGLYIICGESRIYASSDLENFELVYDSTEETETMYGRLECAVYDGEKYIAGGFWTDGLISYDGYEWDHAPYIIHNSRAVSMATVDGYIYMGSNDGGIYRSLDGYDWEEVLPQSGNPINGIAYGNGAYIACGNAGLLLYSRDGVNWENVSAAQSGIEWNAAVFGNGKFFIAGFNSSSTGIKETSKDGKTWTALPTSTKALSGACFGLSAYHEELRSKAENAIAKYREVRKFSAEADGQAKPKYGEDYHIGDICDIYFDGISIRERITKVRHIIEPEKISVTPIFGEDYLNIRQITKRISKFDE